MVQRMKKLESEKKTHQGGGREWFKPWNCSRYPLTGPILALIVLIMGIWINARNTRVLDITWVYAVIIIYTIFTGGIKAGLISLMLSGIYMIDVFHRYLHRHPFMQHTYIYTIGINHIALIVSAFILACMYQRLKMAHKVLQENEICLKRTKEAAEVMMFYGELDGSMQKVPQRFCDFLGYNEEELVGRKFLEFTYTEDQKEEQEKLRQIVQGDEVAYVMVKRFLCKDGKMVWAYVNVLRIDGEDGSPLYLIAYIKDITKNKKIEQELAESREQYRLLVEHSPDAIVVHDECAILFANQAAARLAGVVESRELIGKDIMDFVYSDHKQEVAEKVRLLLREKINISLREEKIITMDHKVIDVELVGIPFVYMEKPAVQVIIRDITDRKNAAMLQKNVEKSSRLLQEAKEYEKLRGDFFANISHELRTPLNVILGTLQLLNLFTQDRLRVDNSQSTIKYINVMMQNCYRLLRLVNNLIDITKIDAGFFQLDLQNVNIVSIIEDITLSVAEYVQSKGITLQFDTDIEEKIIACDPDKMERIMLNLLSNAIKFTNRGDHIIVTVQDQGDFVRICVQDTGIGIPLDKQEVIFERFQQVDKSLTRDHEGSGIGLSLVKSLVEMHKGQISLKSKYKEGSQFIIEIPAHSLPENHQMGQPYSYDTAQSGRIERIHIEFSDIYS